MGASAFDVTHRFVEQDWMRELSAEELEEINDYPEAAEPLGGDQVMLRDEMFDFDGFGLPLFPPIDDEFREFVAAQGCRVITFAAWAGGGWLLDFPEDADPAKVVWAKLRWG